MSRRVTLRDLADVQHPRSPQHGTALLRAGQKVGCPRCGAELQVDTEALKVKPSTGQRVRARVAFCTRCEFAHEF